jgi:hypothetical protein
MLVFVFNCSAAYNGVGWVGETFTNFEFYDVWGTSFRNVYAAGANGTILHFE